MAKTKNFIDKALSDKGDKGKLHRHLGIPEGKTIPLARLKEAANSPDKAIAAEARFALELRGFKKTK